MRRKPEGENARGGRVGEASNEAAAEQTRAGRYEKMKLKIVGRVDLVLY